MHLAMQIGPISTKKQLKPSGQSLDFRISSLAPQPLGHTSANVYGRRAVK